ncbi:Putative ribonuclease H protein At1g65750 [Linum perenne]
MSHRLRIYFESDTSESSPDPKGKFSISSAYDIITAANTNTDPSLWKLVWKWKGPNRVKHFLWLVAHNRLLTNAERHKRHMSTDDSCRLCPDSVEDAIHIIRDCRVAKKLWNEFLPPLQADGVLFREHSGLARDHPKRLGPQPFWRYRHLAAVEGS